MNSFALPNLADRPGRTVDGFASTRQSGQNKIMPLGGSPRLNPHRPPAGSADLRIWRRVAGEGSLDSYVYAPAGGRRSLGTLVSVHGVTRRAPEQFTGWLRFAQRMQITLVAPSFGRDRFAGYQRLAGSKRGLTADHALLRLLDQLRDEGFVGTGPVVLFGYSGGAQFVHRFLLAHPNAADGAAVAAAGWYTFPDRLTPFPYGLATSRLGLAGHLDAFLQKPLLVTVGEADVARDEQLRKRFWMDAWQGRTRVERAERWVEALRNEARRRGVTPRVSLCHLPGAGHSFVECMRAGLGWQVAMFLTGLLPLPDGGSREP